MSSKTYDDQYEKTEEARLKALSAVYEVRQRGRDSWKSSDPNLLGAKRALSDSAIDYKGPYLDYILS